MHKITGFLILAIIFSSTTFAVDVPLETTDEPQNIDPSNNRRNVRIINPNDFPPNENTKRIEKQPVMKNDVESVENNQRVPKRPVMDREAIQEKTQEKKEIMLERREEFNKSKSEIKDARKQQILERLDRNLNRLNQQSLVVLNRTVTMLEKHISSIDTLINQNPTNEEISGRIEEIKQSLSEIKEMIVLQQEKDYVIEINEEEDFRTQMQAQRNLLRSDLAVIHTNIKELRKSLIEVAQLIRETRTQTVNE